MNNSLEMSQLICPVVGLTFFFFLKRISSAARGGGGGGAVFGGGGLLLVVPLTLGLLGIDFTFPPGGRVVGVAVPVGGSIVGRMTTAWFIDDPPELMGLGGFPPASAFLFLPSFDFELEIESILGLRFKGLVIVDTTFGMSSDSRFAIFFFAGDGVDGISANVVGVYYKRSDHTF